MVPDIDRSADFGLDTDVKVTGLPSRLKDRIWTDMKLPLLRFKAVS